MRAMLSAVSGSSSISRTRIRPLPSYSTSLTNITNKPGGVTRTQGLPDENCHKVGVENRRVARGLGNTFRARAEDPGGGHNIFSWKFNRMADRLRASPDLPAARKFIYSARLRSPHESRSEPNETSSAARLPPDRERAFHESDAA